MGKRIPNTTKEYIVDAALPEATETYTVISHSFVINHTLNALKLRGFEVKQELYRCNNGAKIAQGTYQLNYGADPEMGMMFAWSNSYDKSKRFRCAIGAYVYSSGSYLISGSMGSWGRIHTGTADTDTMKTIDEQVATADQYYNQLVKDKDRMKVITVDIQKRAEILGRLYLEHEIINTEQLSAIKNQFKNPSYDYGTPKDSLWDLYNHLILALQKSHPSTWMDQQRAAHWFITNEFGITEDVIQIPEPAVSEDVISDPSQLSLIDAITEVENGTGAL